MTTLVKYMVTFWTELETSLDTILAEVKASKGRAMDIGGYYHPCPDKVKAAMGPSAAFNKILAILG